MTIQTVAERQGRQKDRNIFHLLHSKRRHTVCQVCIRMAEMSKEERLNFGLGLGPKKKWINNQDS